MILTPQQIENAARDIVDFWTQSELPENDKAKILEMVQEYYGSKDEYLHEQYLSALTKRTIESNVPQTGFETRNDS